MSRYTEELIRREAQLEEMRRDEQDDQNFLLGIIVIMAAVAGATFTLFIVGMAVLMMFLGAFSRGAPVAQVGLPPAVTLPAPAPGATQLPASAAPATAAPGIDPLVATPPLAADPATDLAQPPAPATIVPAEVPPIAPNSVLPPTAPPPPAADLQPPPASQPPAEPMPATAIPQLSVEPPTAIPPPVVAPPATAAIVPPPESPTVVPPAVTPTAALPASAVDPLAATPTAAFTTGGLGLSRAEWEGMYGPVIDPAAGVARYGDPGVYTQDVNYVDDRVQAIIWRTDQPIMVENALSVGNTYAPADGQYVTSYAPEGRPDTNVDVYTSQMLAARLGADNKWWNGSVPGTYIVQYTRTPTGVTSVDIGTGNTPFP